MSSSRRNRDRRPGRRLPFRDPKPLVLVVCEGEKTEPQYFDGFRRACRNPRVTIYLAPERGDPKALVEAAKQYKKEAERNAVRENDDNASYDSFWCVFDIDDHERVGDAKQMARDNGIELAVSNPCFELWLLLHFRDSPGMQHRDKVRELLTGCVPEYRKQVDYATYAAGYLEAVARAERLDRAATNDGELGRNPTTGVYRLTEIIRGE